MSDVTATRTDATRTESAGDRPATLAGVTPTMVDAYFKPLARDLTFDD